MSRITGRTATSRTAWMDDDVASEISNASVDDVSAAIADLAANTRDNATARVVRQYYRTILPNGRPSDRERSEATDGQPGAAQTTAPPAIDRPKLQAPILPEQRSGNIVSYHALQEWEGYVTSIDDETFTADLVDMTRGAKQADEHVELSLDEIGFEQRSELRLGAVFRWTIGYETLPSAQRRRVSQLVFRQLPRWTKADLNAATKQGSDRQGKINWE